MDYAQLNETKNELIALQQQINQNSKRLLILNKNTKERSDVVKFLQLAYKTMSEELKVLNSEYFDIIKPDNSNNLNKEIMSGIACTLCNRIVPNETLYDTVCALLEKSNTSNYLTLKTLIKQSKKPLVDIPKKIMSNNLNCKLYMPDCGDPIDPKLMFKTFEVETFVVDDLKSISYPKDIGQFVAMCDEPAIIEKSTGEIIQQAMVSYFTVKLSDRFAKFQFVK